MHLYLRRRVRRLCSRPRHDPPRPAAVFIAPVVPGVAVLERAEELKVGLIKLERLRVERLVVVVVVRVRGGVGVGFVCLLLSAHARIVSRRRAGTQGRESIPDLPSSALLNTLCDPSAGELRKQNQILVREGDFLPEELTVRSRPKPEERHVVRSRVGQDEPFQEARLVKDAEEPVPARETDPAVPASRLSVAILEGTHGEVVVHCADARIFLAPTSRVFDKRRRRREGGRELAREGFVLRVAVIDFVRSSSVRESDHAVRDEDDETARCAGGACTQSVKKEGVVRGEAGTDRRELEFDAQTRGRSDLKKERRARQSQVFTRLRE